jgi:hypothetical protein
MLRAVVVDNGIHGLREHFVNSPAIRYRFERITADWRPIFEEDVVIVPNGSDHLAMLHARASIEAVLARGAAVLSFCGCYTPWLPGTIWAHDNTRPNIEVRYHVINDPLDLMGGVDPARLSTDDHGISGWWACGALHTARPDSVVLADTWQRPVLIADMGATRGLIIATASGPLGESDPDAADDQGVRRLYRNIIRAVARDRESRHA